MPGDRRQAVYHLGTAIGALHGPADTHWANIATAELHIALALIELTKMDPDGRARDLLLEVLMQDKERRDALQKETNG